MIKVIKHLSPSYNILKGVSALSDYKRIVSYIYDYQDGVKKNNVGFARVEARNDQCKIMIHLKAPSLNNNELKAYIFYRRENEITPVFIENILVRNGIGDLKGITRVDDIMDSSKPLDQMCGIIAYYSDDKYFATEWDDKPVILHNFIDSQVTHNEKKDPDKEETAEISQNINVNEMETKKGTIKETIKDYIKEMMDGNKGEETESSEKVTKEDNKEDDKEVIHKDMTANIKKETSEVKKDNRKEAVKDDNIQDTDKEKKEKIETAAKEEDRKIEKSHEEDAKKDTSVENITENQKEDSQETEKESTAEEALNITKENITEDSKEVMKEEIREKEEKIVPLAARIFSRYTKMFPFEDNEIAECVRIEPQDIGVLPMENWVLGNNSFLLHGYYNYRHLIFARRRTSDGSQYIIGVPGVFQNREKFMAKLFGFEKFKPTGGKGSDQGEFGYWYTDINI